ncbi:MAG TPA: SCO family protein [Stellaceae bacterium]
MARHLSQRRAARFAPYSRAVKTSFRLLLTAAIAALLIGGGMLAVILVERPGAPPAETSTATGASIGGPFTLVSADGRTVTDRDYRGKWMLVYFGYTFCPDVCPTTLNNIAQALAKLGPDAKAIEPLFITVDPKRDTPKLIGEYVKAFDPRIIGLTGGVAQIADVAKEYRVYYAPEPGNGNDYLVDHSSFVYLMNPQGVFAKVMPGNTSGGDMAAAIRPFIDSNS